MLTLRLDRNSAVTAEQGKGEEPKLIRIVSSVVVVVVVMMKKKKKNIINY